MQLNESFTESVNVPAQTPVKIFDAYQLFPSMLYWYGPAGPVTGLAVIVPLQSPKQIGDAEVADGVMVGVLFTVTVCVAVQFKLFFIVTVYVPAHTLENKVDDCHVFPPSILYEYGGLEPDTNDAWIVPLHVEGQLCCGDVAVIANGTGGLTTMGTKGE